jgi:hypothetical protein
MPCASKLPKAQQLTTNIIHILTSAKALSSLHPLLGRRGSTAQHLATKEVAQAEFSNDTESLITILVARNKKNR